MDSVIIFCASYLIFFVFLLTLFTLYKTNKRREMFIALAVGTILALALTKLAGALYFDPRPFVKESVVPLIKHGADNGFPSEHTVAAVTLATIIYFYRRKFAAVALVMAMLVGTGRVLAHVHSWIDIIAGAAIGVVAGYAAVRLARYAEPRLSAKRPVKHH